MQLSKSCNFSHGGTERFGLCLLVRTEVQTDRWVGSAPKTILVTSVVDLRSSGL
jgi:hypothetical protein